MKKDSKYKIASVYAEALYEAAVSKKAVEKVFADIKKLQKAVAEEPDFVKYFSNPLWEVASKRKALNEISAKLKLSKETLSCLDILAENNRFPEFDLVLDSFVRLYYAKQNITEVEVTSAVKLSAEQDKKLIAAIQNKLGQKIVVSYVVDPEILGGLKVQYGSTLIDDSVLGKLNRFEIMMKGGQ